MAHELDFSKGRAAIAYVGETPWHGLGQKMEGGKSIEDWQVAAGMDFEIIDKPVKYNADGFDFTFPDRKVLHRSDNNAPLSIVSSKYKVVQPKTVLEFYRDLTEQSGFVLDTAGVLFNGRKYWALASMGNEAKVLDDSIKGYLLLGTACDGTMATTAMFTSVRVVCNNTLGFAMRESETGEAKNVVKVTHSSTFDVADVKSQLGIAATSWDAFIKNIDVWSDTHIDLSVAKEYLSQFAVVRDLKGALVVSDRTLDKLTDLYQGSGIGMDMVATKNTVWGLINTITEYVDHHKGRSSDTRMDRAWFGDGVMIKNRAVELANALV